jgi:glycosyltransferase involved in cell wall biosynthesis
MKKIAIICNYELLPERVGGMDRFFWLFNQKCLQLNYQIDWFFPNVSDHGNYSQLHIIAPEKNQSLESNFLRFSESQTEKYDVVITHFLELCTSFSKKVKQQNPKTKFIAIDHNPRPIGGYPLKKKIEKRIKGLLYASYINLFVGVSDYTRKNILIDFGNHLNKKTIVVYNGIEFQHYKIRENRANLHPTFLVACHLRASKGIQDLIEAIHLLPIDIKNQIKIDIYGKGAYQSHLEALISKYNLKENFSFKGSVNNLYDIYFQYDYLLQPTHMECFSLSILESLSANVPVITTSVGGNEEAIQHNHNGYIYKPKDVLTLKEIIQKVFEGKLIISENTRTLIETHFTIDKMVKEHINLI